MKKVYVQPAAARQWKSINIVSMTVVFWSLVLRRQKLTSKRDHWVYCIHYIFCWFLFTYFYLSLMMRHAVNWEKAPWENFSSNRRRKSKKFGNRWVDALNKKKLINIFVLFLENITYYKKVNKIKGNCKSFFFVFSLFKQNENISIHYYTAKRSRNNLSFS